MLQKLHHQVLSHLAATRASAKIATRNPQCLVRGNIADIEVMVMHVFSNLLVIRLIGAMKATKKMKTGVAG